MKKGLAPFHANRRGYHLLLDAVPAWICSQCGEAYFGELEVEAIQRLLRQLDRQTQRLAPVA